MATILLLAGLAAGQAPKLKNPLGNGQEVVTAGRRLYNNSCTMCHGPDGAEGDRGPALAASRRYFRLSENAIFDAIKNGIAGTAMPATGLPDDDIWRIVAFIRNLRATASDTPVEGDVEKGRRVFEGKGNCAACHAIRGKGGFLGPDLSNVGGERSLAQIRNSLVEPRPAPRGYKPARVVTVDGRKFEGVVKNEDAFSLQLLGRDHKLHLFTREELREVIHEEKSMMPANYEKLLDTAEMRDLLAFLSRQVRQKMNIEQPGGNEVGR